ncbi:uncharacterized protein ColSpa_07121 [Colletotrichum spaethianum]|uniref:Uncharacterized protein n=1 Tax=Colletotrichum spaethianum TaxID=700344 RepID=A0AA37P1L7_9PEZI|nr:uncharacterized protein ColSpa_07121 [Colletotrichum spaethianum]GKT46940.1 hypothetical protein ColSpa_07121 [Colletotrichum spaethianum]
MRTRAQELIWNCRQGRIFPRNLRKYKLATLVIGTIATRPNAVYQRMDSPNSVTQDCVLRVDTLNPNPAPAVQYVFSAEEGEYFLRQHVGDNIRVTPFVRSDLEDWINEFRSMLG